jgi:hypothetical protein
MPDHHAEIALRVHELTRDPECRELVRQKLREFVKAVDEEWETALEAAKEDAKLRDRAKGCPGPGWTWVDVSKGEEKKKKKRHDGFWMRYTLEDKLGKLLAAGAFIGDMVYGDDVPAPNDVERGLLACVVMAVIHDLPCLYYNRLAAGILEEEELARWSESVTDLQAAAEGRQRLRGCLIDVEHLLRKVPDSDDDVVVERPKTSATAPSELSERGLECLQVMRECGAISRDHRITETEIAVKVYGGRAAVGAMKQPLAKLRQLKLVKALRGRTGGYWLTENGVSYLSDHNEIV